MRILAYVLIVAATIGMALVATRSPDTTDWMKFSVPLAAGIVGVTFAQISKKTEGSSAEVVSHQISTLERSAAAIKEILGGTLREKQGQWLMEGIDSELSPHLTNFADARKSLVHRYDLQSYAEVMNHFAAGERYLNRVWSCSADDYHEEAAVYFDHATEQFAEVQRLLNSLSPSDS
ncbi:MAG: hypothetical protein AAF517_08760 [Planctomycetota bacterium]